MSKQAIVIIDDDDLILTMLRTSLEKNGFSVMTASNGSDGLKIVNENTTDGIILDKKMSGMDGTAVLKALKSNDKTKNIPVMMITGVPSSNDPIDYYALGVNDYLTKPFTSDHLIKRTRLMLSK